ncbi:MAG TPA: hypothetical protein VF205_03100, partial [Nitrospiraceae bacterium]
GVPLGGRVRKLRAVDDQSAPIPGEGMDELGRSMRGQMGIHQALHDWPVSLVPPACLAHLACSVYLVCLIA